MGLLKELALADVESEIAATRRVLARVPADRLNWKPHEKSMSLGELAAHVVNIVGWMVPILTSEEIDFAAAPPPATRPDSTARLQADFEANVVGFHSAFETLDESTLTGEWTLRVGERVIFTRPRLGVLRSFALSHAAHHRGQLTVYLRLLDVPLPSVYGPTADEP